MAKRKQNFNNQNQNQNRTNINQYIKSNEVRLVGDNVTPGIYTYKEAMDIADGQELDLVEISKNGGTSICKVIDFNKYQYEQKKQEKENKKKQSINKLKEVQFGPNTDEHDYNFKMKNVIGFLQKGSVVRALVFFKGREITFAEKGRKILTKLIEDVEKYGTCDSFNLKMEGNRMIIFLKPIKKNN